MQRLMRWALALCLSLGWLPGSAAVYPLPPAGGNVVGQVAVVHAKAEDTFPDIARRYGLGYDQLKDANPGVDPWLPKAGTPIVLPTEYVLPDAPRVGIVINLPAMRLFYYPKPKAGEPPVVVTYPIGIGREGWKTPIGSTVVTAKVKDPAWYPPESVRKEHATEGDVLPRKVPAGPDNPLGDHALRLGWAGYLIHGTDKPWGVGMRVSHGCIRLYPEDIGKLFAGVTVRTPVRVVNQPYLIGQRGDEILLQAYRPLDSDTAAGRQELSLAESISRRLAPGTAVDWQAAQAAVAEARGIPTPIASGYPGLATRIAQAPVLAPESGEGAPEAQSPSPHSGLPTGDGQWYLPVASFRDPANADRVVNLLRGLSPPVPAAERYEEGVHLVMAGPFAVQAEAKAAAERIERDLGIRPSVPVAGPS